MKFAVNGSSPFMGEVRRGWRFAVWLTCGVSPSPDLSLDGRGGVWSEPLGLRVINRILDDCENTLEVVPNFRIPETQDAKALTCKKFITNFVSGAIQVLAAVGFYNYFMFKANKIKNISAHRFLAAEFCPEVFTAQMFPEDALFWGHSASKFSGDVRQSHIFHYEVAGRV